MTIPVYSPPVVVVTHENEVNVLSLVNSKNNSSETSTKSTNMKKW